MNHKIPKNSPIQQLIPQILISGRINFLKVTEIPLDTRPKLNLENFSHHYYNEYIIEQKYLTHFWPIFHLLINQVIDFYWQNVSETPVEEWHFK